MQSETQGWRRSPNLAPGALMSNVGTMTELRHDWNVDEVLAVIERPFHELLADAHRCHVERFEAQEIEAARRCIEARCWEASYVDDVGIDAPPPVVGDAEWFEQVRP